MAFDDGRVVSNFIVQAIRGEPLTIYGDGSQTRSFCFVSDLVDGLVKMMNFQTEFIGPVNIGNPVEFQVVALAKKIIELTNSSSVIVNTSLPEDDPKQRKPDISLAQKMFGWEPSVSLDDGLTKTIHEFRSRIIDV